MIGQKPKVLTGMLYLCALCLFGCSAQEEQNCWNYSDSDITGAHPIANTQSDSVTIDLFVDASTSMLGFTKDQSSHYCSFLDQLEASCNLCWKKSTVRFYKFGTYAKSITRDEYLASKSPGFYRDQALALYTNIDTVIERTSANVLSLVVTDLFQREGDVNVIVHKIKERCFKKDIYVGILAIKGYYDGQVYDAKVPPYHYTSTQGDESTYRNFYLLMFGNPIHFERLFQSLKQKSYIRDEQCLIISSYIVSKYSLTLKRDLKAQGLTALQRKPRQFHGLSNFIMKKGFSEGSFNLAMTYQRNAHSLAVSEKDLELVAFKKSFGLNAKSPMHDSSQTQDLSLGSMNASATEVQGRVHLMLPDERGTYSYVSYLQIASFHPGALPGWVSDFSAENPQPGSNAEKTLNLHKFIADLAQALITVRPPNLGKFYLTIKKQ